MLTCWLQTVGGQGLGVGVGNCGCTDIPPGEEHSCQQQLEWGKCKRSWMIDWDYCAVTCGRCKCFGDIQCTDIPPSKHYTCAEQKEWGKCGEEWLSREGYCDISCGRCPQQGALISSPVIDVQQESGMQQETATISAPEVVERPPKIESVQFEVSSTVLNEIPTQKDSASITQEDPVQLEAVYLEVPRIVLNESPTLESPPTQTLADEIAITSIVPRAAFPMSLLPTQFLPPSTSTLMPTPIPTPTPTPVTTSDSSSSCQCTDIPPGRSFTCAQQKALGKCMRGWMLSRNHCETTCGRCHCLEDVQGGETITCTDVPPSKDYSCEEQRRYGQCQQSWMIENGYCNYSCQRCGAQSTPKSTKEPFSQITSQVAQQAPQSFLLIPSSPMLLPQDTSFVAAMMPAIEDLITTPESNALISNPLSLLREDYDMPEVTTVSSNNYQRQYRQLATECEGTLMEQISKRPYLSLLNQLLPRSGLSDKISNTIGGVTLFAPEDDAFRALVEDEEIMLQDLFVNPTFSEGVLPQLLAYHVIPRKLSVRSLAVVSVSDTMLPGDENLIFIKSSNPLVIEGRSSEAEVVEQDIVACDGIIHIIDGILLPVPDVQMLIDSSSSQSSSIPSPTPAPNVFMPVPFGIPAPSNSIASSVAPIAIPSVLMPDAMVLESRVSQTSQYEPPIESILIQDSLVSQVGEPPEQTQQIVRETKCRNVGVLDILEDIPNTEILTKMIKELELESVLEPPITLFAPEDEAMELLATKLGQNSVDDLLIPENQGTIVNILYYHMVPSVVRLETLNPNTPLHNINDSLLYVLKENENGEQATSIRGIGSAAKILDVEEDVQNGCNVSVHLVDTALLPFTILQTEFPNLNGEALFAPPPPPKSIYIPEEVIQTAPPGILDGLVPDEIINRTRAGELSGPFVVNVTKGEPIEFVEDGEAQLRQATQCPSLLDILQSRDDLTLMNALVQHAGLAPLLNYSRVEYTLLAPTDKAVQDLVIKLGPRSQSLTDQEVLKNVLGYHIIRDAIEKDDLEVGLELPTLVAWLGKSLKLLVEKNDEFGIVGDNEEASDMLLVGIGSEARIIEWDLKACDSILHIIDDVLLPVDTQ